MGTKIKKDGRKVLLFVPLLIVPFMALAFYAMGGGTGQSALPSPSLGINTNLPEATFSKDTLKTKADYYDQAGRNLPRQENGIAKIAGQLGFDADGKVVSVSEHDQTRQINEKLEALHKEISRPAEPLVQKSSSTVAKQESNSIRNDVDRLEKLMKTMQENKKEDPEMLQLNSMMQSILDIQHPERVQQRLQTIKSLNPDSQFKATPAIIVDHQKAVQGATIKIKLQDSIRINGVLIPKGHELYGICRITNQRLLLDIKNIRLGTSIIPVDLSVYSLDGMAGMYAPEALLTDAIGDGTSNAIGNVGIMGYDLTTQVAGAGIDAAKSLLTKRIKRVKVKLEAGKAILLRNNKQKVQ